jgi:hypothetical protein
LRLSGSFSVLERIVEQRSNGLFGLAPVLEHETLHLHQMADVWDPRALAKLGRVPAMRQLRRFEQLRLIL